MSSKREIDNYLCLKPRIPREFYSLVDLLKFHGIYSQNGVSILFRFIPLDRIISRDFKVIVMAIIPLTPFVCINKAIFIICIKKVIDFCMLMLILHTATFPVRGITVEVIRITSNQRRIV